MISGLPVAMLAYAAQSPEARTDPAFARALGAGATRALFDANYLAAGMALMTGALFLAAAGIAISLGELARPWLGWLALLAGVVMLYRPEVERTKAPRAVFTH